MTKSGSDELTFSNDNSGSLASPILLTGGSLIAGDDGAFGTGQITMSNATTLGASSNASLSNTIAISGATGIVDTSNTLTLTSAISGNELVKNGSGNLILDATETYTGGTTINAGTVTLSDDGAFSTTGTVDVDGTLAIATDAGAKTVSVIAGTGDIALNNNQLTLEQGSFSGDIAGTGGSVVKSGNNTLTLTGTNGFTGGLTVSAGTLSVNADGALGATNDSPTLNGGTLNTSADITTTSRGFVMGSNSGTFDTDQATTLESTGVVSGAGGLTKTGAGGLTLAAASTYSGTTTISAGTMTLTGSGTIPAASATTVASAGILAIDNGAGAKSINTLSGAGGINIGNNTLTVQSGSISGVISGTGGTLTKSDSGTLTLSGSNTFDTGLNILGGTLSVNSDAALGDSGISPVINGGTLGVSQAVTLARGFGIGTSNGTINSNENISITGVIANSGGAGQLTKSGSGTLTLTGANTYTGGTTLSGGGVTLSGVGSSLSTTGTTTLGSGTTLTLASGAGDKSLGTVNGAGNIVLNANTLSIADGTLTGVTSGTGGITKTGTGTLIPSGSDTYTGNTTIEGGTFQAGSNQSFGGAGSVIIDGGTVATTNSYTSARSVQIGSNNGTINTAADTTWTVSGAMSGTGALTKSGTGTLLLSGNSGAYAGATTLDAGTLNVSGTTGSTITVGSNATLKGTGTVGGIVNNGSLEPGASIGTLTTTTFTQGAGGTLTVEITPTESDLLIVTGTATLDGTVFVSPSSGSYPEGTEFTILTAGTRIGEFAQVTDNVDVIFHLRYSGNTVFLRVPTAFSLLPVSVSELTGNARVMGDYLFCVSEPGGRGVDLTNVENILSNLSAEEFPIGLNRLSPAQYGALPLANGRMLSRTMSTITPVRLGCNPSLSRAYIAPLYSNEHQNPRDAMYGFTSNNYGFVIGGDKHFRNGMFVGFAGGYTYTDLNWKKNAGDAENDNFYGGPYVGYSIDQIGFLFAPIIEYTHYDTKRVIQFTGFDRTAEAKFSSWSVGSHLDIFYNFYLPYDITIGPEFVLDFVNTQMESFVEKQAGSVNCDMESQMYRYFNPQAKLKIGRDLHVKGMIFTPYVTGGYDGTIILSNENITSRFYEQQGTCTPTFTVDSFKYGIHQFAGKLGLSITKCNEITADLSYEAATGGHNLTQTGEVKFNWTF